MARVLDVRRHTMRRKPEQHLSREGIVLASMVAKDNPKYDRVVTSSIPRAIETAIVMGLEVDELVEALGYLPDDASAEIDFPSPFSRVSQAVAADGSAARFAEAQAALWRRLAMRMPDGGRMLIVSHGLIVELGATASLPGADHASWGDAIGYCEGIRLSYEDDLVRGELLRLPVEHRLIEN